MHETTKEIQTPADGPLRPLVDTGSPPHPLALDPLSPIPSGPIVDPSSMADPLGLDPLGPIRRF